MHRNISIHRYSGCLYEIEIQIFKKDNLIGRRNRLDTKYFLSERGRYIQTQTQ